MNKAKQNNNKGKSAKSSELNSTKGRWLTWLLAFSIAIITFIVFSPSMKCDFAGKWDDGEYVTENPMVMSAHIPVKEIFHTPVSLNYHPLTILSLAYNYQSYKLNPAGYHLWNVMLHVFNTILVFFFVYLLTKRNQLMASIVSLFFGIHPMHVESVTWISERKDVLYVFFFAGGLISYLKYVESKKTVWYIITLLLFVLSCLSKAMAVVFPIILMLIDYYLNADKNPLPIWKRRNIRDKIPLFIVSLIFGIEAYSIQQSGNIMQAMQVFSFAERIMFAAYGALMYIVKLIAPVNLSAFYAYPIYNPTHSLPAIIYAAPFLFFIIAVLVYLFFRKEKAVVFGSLFYLVSVLLVLQFVSVGNAIMADRYSYLSYIGLLFIIAFIINSSMQKGSKLSSIKYPILGLVVVSFFVFSYKTYSQTKVWTNAETLWNNAINIDPEQCYTGYVNRGIVYQKRGENDKALADFTKSLEINSSVAVAYIDRGAIYSDFGKDTLALADFGKAIELNPNNAEVYYNRGRIHEKFLKHDAAISDYNKAIEINPNYTLAYMNRGIVYANRQQNDSALADYNKAIETNPEMDIPYYNRASIYYAKGEYELALADFTKAINLNSNTPQYWQYRSLTYQALGRTADAQADDNHYQQMIGAGK